MSILCVHSTSLKGECPLMFHDCGEHSTSCLYSKEIKMTKRGRKLGSVYGPSMGSLAYWIVNAEIGDTTWTEQGQKAIHIAATRNGMKVTVEGFVAVRPGKGKEVEAYKLARITKMAAL